MTALLPPPPTAATAISHGPPGRRRRGHREGDPMNAQTKIEKPTLAKLREPFPDNQISWLPKETRAQIDERKNRVQGCMVWNCPQCGGSHHKNAVHLQYVGHAALTDRLLDVDPEWSWEPMGLTDEGLPAFDKNGGLWIKLTVLGMTRPGYGCADGKSGGDAVKEIIGDALRNAAMRFGAALDLWHKGDLHAEDGAEPDAAGGQSNGARSAPGGNDDSTGMPDAEWAKLVQLVEATASDTTAMCKHYGVKNLRHLDQGQYASAVKALKAKLAEKAKAETNERAKKAEPPASEFDDLDADSIPY